jgi:pimeloyl-ACP methyl ester carboxylesterase
MHQISRGSGRKLLLVHGLGGSWRSWSTILDPLSASRTIIAIDLPGHGATPVQPDSGTFDGLVGSVQRYIVENGLTGIDVVGSSMGARIVLELARRGMVGNVVALDPGGFWRGWERSFFKTTIGVSGRLLRAIRPGLPTLSRNAASRTALLAQLSAHPWALDPQTVATELTGLSTTQTFDALVHDLANGPEQTGPAADSTGRIVIGWGRHDRLCLPRQAARAKAAFPSAELHWFESSGHFPMWDMPEETIEVILQATL